MTRRQASPSSRGTTGNARHRQPWPQEGAGVSTREFRPTFRPQAEQRPRLLSRQEGTHGGRGKERLSVPQGPKEIIRIFRNSQKTPNHKNTAEKGKITKSHETPMGRHPCRWEAAGRDGCNGGAPHAHGGPAATSAPHPRVSAESGPGLRGLRLARPSAFSRPSGQRSFRRGKPRGPAKTRADADSWGSGQRRSRGALKARMQGAAGSQEDQAGCQHEGGQGCH